MTSKADLAAKQELARRILARRRLLEFTRYTLPDYDAGWVHYDMAARLERFSRAVIERKSPRLMLLVPPRHGKLLAHSTEVPTPTGPKLHGDLVPGDFVFSPSGKAVKVVAVSAEDQASVEVETFTGEKIVCHPAHEWKVFDRSQHKWRVVETRYLMEEIASGSPRARFQLPMISGLQYQHKPLPIDPYFLGVWLGDGKASEPVICGGAEDMEHIVSKITYPAGCKSVHKDTGVVYQGFKGGIRAQLRLNGLLNNKHIPEIYQTSAENQRRELLAGLVDTDGSMEPGAHRIRFRSSSRQLIDDVTRLVRGLGYRASVDYTPPDTRDRKITGGESWCVQWTPHDGKGGGTLPRKIVGRSRARRMVGIRSVTPCEPQRGRCIQVDSPDGLYLVGKTLVPTHNSELASIRLPAFHLGHAPHHEVINCGYNLDLPMIFSKKVRGLLRDPLYHNLYPGTMLDPETQATEAWMTTKGGGFKAAGVGGGITGKGAHVLIIDDPLKNMEEADSADRRDLLDDWYQSTAFTRLAPGGGVLLIETWWNWDDLAGRLQRRAELNPKADQFEVVMYPALSTAYEYRDEETWEIIRLPEPMIDYDTGRFTLLRETDKALHESRYSTDVIKQFRENLLPRIWSALYQQSPMPDEGVYFKKELFRFLDRPPAGASPQYQTTWDFAIGQKQQNDYTVGATMSQDETSMITVHDIDRFKGDAFEIVDTIIDVAERWMAVSNNNYRVGVEDGQIWKSIEPVLRRRMEERRVFFAIEVMKPLTDKLARARPLQGRMQQGKVIFPSTASWRDIMEKEMLQFPGGKHDDIVDALAWGVRLAIQEAPPKMVEPKRQPSWRDNLRLVGGTGVSHMSA